ncbi:hypothetical protein F5148DRAFT_712319 [Russula earlei]|uniref:Uncharacterized protein n=1 Tax=Russula earlei TaxID=71964 RepID=A0ACC0TTV8_9AGAM|nr:hypothetical protein F5148DRAFT_712319 [Russula earlei]
MLTLISSLPVFLCFGIPAYQCLPPPLCPRWPRTLFKYHLPCTRRCHRSPQPRLISTSFVGEQFKGATILLDLSAYLAGKASRPAMKSTTTSSLTSALLSPRHQSPYLHLISGNAMRYQRGVYDRNSMPS